MIIVGDFNVWIDINSNKNAKTLLGLMNAFGLNQLINVPTHNAGHTLDHVYVNEKQIDIKVEVLEDKLNVSTDHKPILLQLPTLGKIDNAFISYRKIKNINIDTFKEEFVDIVEKLDFVNSDFDYNFNTFIKYSRELIDKHAPLITRNVSKNVKPKWVDEEFIRSRAKRRKLEKAWQKNKYDKIKRRQYIEQRELCAQMSKRKQQEYYTKLINESNNDQKTLFKIANTILNKKNNRILPNHTNPIDLANEFNNYYIDKIDKIRETITETVDKITIMKL